MAMQYKGVGIRNVGSYQASGDPYISGTVGAQTQYTMKRYEFPTVVREFTVVSVAQQIAVHFVSGSAGFDFSSTDTVSFTNDAGWGATEMAKGNHFWNVSEGSSVTFRTKCKEIYVSALTGSTTDYNILAELTNIPTQSMYHLTGSGKTSIDGT